MRGSIPSRASIAAAASPAGPPPTTTVSWRSAGCRAVRLVRTSADVAGSDVGRRLAEPQSPGVARERILTGHDRRTAGCLGADDGHGRREPGRREGRDVLTGGPTC